MTSAVCCCRLRTATKIVAWLQLISFIFCICPRPIFTLAENLYVAEDERSRTVTQSYSRKIYDLKPEDSALKEVLLRYLDLVIYFIVMIVMQITATVYLLSGVNKGRPRNIKNWFILSSLGILGAFLQISPQILIYYVIHIYFFWVVCRYYKQVTANPGPTKPGPEDVKSVRDVTYIVVT